MTSTTDAMRRLQLVADVAAARKIDSTRHKCFVSYHVADIDEVETFINTFGSEFIARSVGVTVEDDFVDSDDEEYVKRRIREKYLTDSSVTILLLGECTWARRFVDWAILLFIAPRHGQQEERTACSTASKHGEFGSATRSG